ncbi:hypothetical protein VS873_24050, partial [Salmonella enterica subsp. enterica serovar Typhi]|nr:hypothetical protein [Salmonella enterica subsp. enterica serovar Typhi]
CDQSSATLTRIKTRYERLITANTEIIQFNYPVSEADNRCDQSSATLTRIKTRYERLITANTEIIQFNYPVS